MSKGPRFGLLLLFLVLAGLGAYFSTGSFSFEAGKIYYIFIVCLTIYAAIVAGYDFYHASQTNENARRVDHAIRFLEQFDSRELRLARDKTRELRDKKSETSDNDLIAMIDNDPDTKRSIIHMFNYWERVYSVIMRQAIDEEMIKEHLAHVYIGQHDRFNCWLEASSKPHNKVGCENLLKLHDRWKAYVDQKKNHNTFKRCKKLVS